MHKETVLAVGIGLLFGLFVTVGVYKLIAGSNNDAASTDVEQIVATPTPSGENRGELTLVSPTDGFITTDQEIEVSGSVAPDSFVILYLTDAQQIYKADDQGAFSFPLSLEEGPNFFTVTSVNNEGKSASIDRVVVYEPEIPAEPTPTEAP